MAKSMRFGRRLALPSTRQIRHELLVFSAKEEARRKELDQSPTAEAAPAAPATDQPLVG